MGQAHRPILFLSAGNVVKNMPTTHIKAALTCINPLALINKSWAPWLFHYSRLDCYQWQ